MGSSGRFRYVDARGNRITDEDKLARIRTLVIPPAWKDVWISPSARAKLQATGVDAAGRRQYLYHADFRAQQQQAKFDKLIRFAERLPDLRAATSEHMEREELDRLRVSAIATRLINAGWFRVGSERYAKESRTYGITTLRKSHVRVRGKRLAFDFVGCLLWASAFILLGYASGLQLEVMQEGLRMVTVTAQTLIVAAIATWVVARFVRRVTPRLGARFFQRASHAADAVTGLEQQPVLVRTSTWPPYRPPLGQSRDGPP